MGIFTKKQEDELPSEISEIEELKETVLNAKMPGQGEKIALKEVERFAKSTSAPVNTAGRFGETPGLEGKKS